MVNSLLHQAASQGASDIHLEPTENNLRVRLRIDGVLYDVAPIPKDVLLLVTSRIKILAGMDIAEKRLPQDANFQFKWQDRLLNIRVSTMPTIYGEKVVLRILDPHKIDMPINKLGFQKDNLQRYLSFLHNSFGMILVTGPTGCGKTTTLYSTLNHINSAEKNIITIEDPVEYRLPGINQVQINNKIKQTFANCLRAILRQDPNIIMVGEIRDAETAEIAARAALTGHLVFSTLHTNDAPRAVTRLLDMGVEPFLLVSSLVGVVSQRLIRIICPHCKEEDELEKDEELLYKKISRKNSLPVFYRGRG
ncbi:MAG: type II/IV secretion system protein, partial [Firmicutes bacterium]|nr:type II/IV secretion system protein [Bacillota bacterium]